ncbi:MAG: hypothetical protein HZB39_17005 [Planctomycetes bacterium]|nr:hypothetical protein [Planctomycetota bacterium]
MSAGFPWHETKARLRELDATSRAGSRIVLPAVLPPIAPGETLDDWLARVPDALGVQVVVLLRAGSAALGLWDGDECVVHKVFTRYVVRGNGKAQPLHAKTKGKSRYGARLRLQNARRLLEEVGERLVEWFATWPAPEAIHWSCPVRQWPELFAANPPPPFPRDDPRLRRIAMHVHEPRFEELLRVRRALARGRIGEATDRSRS